MADAADGQPKREIPSLSLLHSSQNITSAMFHHWLQSQRMNVSREPITNRARGQKQRRSSWVRLFELVRLRLLSSSSAEDAAAAADAKVTSRQHACSGLLMTSPGDIISDGRGLVEGVWAAVAERNTASNSEREKDSYTLHKASRGSVKISRFLGLAFDVGDQDSRWWRVRAIRSVIIFLCP